MMVEISGLWAGKDKNGNSYMKGKMGSATVFVMKNTKKGDNPKAPDYRLLVAPPKPKNEAPGAQNDSDEIPF